MYVCRVAGKRYSCACTRVTSGTFISFFPISDMYDITSNVYLVIVACIRILPHGFFFFFNLFTPLCTRDTRLSR